jgi:hypothetical protein
MPNQGIVPRELSRTQWRMLEREGDRVVMGKIAIATLTICAGGWYDVRPGAKWHGGNVIKVTSVGLLGAVGLVFKENRRTRHRERRELGEATVPFGAFESEVW